MREAISAYLHRAWTECVGQPRYVKRRWLELEREIYTVDPPSVLSYADAVERIDALRREQLAQAETLTEKPDVTKDS